MLFLKKTHWSIVDLTFAVQQWHIYIYVHFFIFFSIMAHHRRLNLIPCERQKDLICIYVSFQFSSVAQSCPTFCNPTDCSMPGLRIHHQLLEFTQTHVHWVGDTIQPSHPVLSPSPPAFNLCQHQGLFQWVSSSHQVAKVLELQLQHQSFQSIFRVDFL